MTTHGVSTNNCLLFIFMVIENITYRERITFYTIYKSFIINFFYNFYKIWERAAYRLLVGIFEADVSATRGWLMRWAELHSWSRTGRGLSLVASLTVSIKYLRSPLFFYSIFTFSFSVPFLRFSVYPSNSQRENSPVTQSTPEPTLLTWGGWPRKKDIPPPLATLRNLVLSRLSGHSDPIVLESFDVVTLWYSSVPRTPNLLKISLDIESEFFSTLQIDLKVESNF